MTMYFCSKGYVFKENKKKKAPKFAQNVYVV